MVASTHNSAETSESVEKRRKPVIKSKPTPARRDPVKRREQNRQSQKTYREKQRRRIEELERIAVSAGKSAIDVSAPAPSPAEAELGSLTSASSIAQPASLPEPFLDVDEIIDPSVLEDDSALVPFQPTTYVDPAIFFANSDQWRDDHQDNSPIQSSLSSAPSLSSSPSSSQTVEEVYFDCGCSNLHIRVNRLNLYLPVAPNFFANTLRIDVWCSLAGLLENCRVLGIPKASFCGDDAESPFFRLASSERESAQLVASVRAMTGAVKHDLRPTSTQVVRSHHPYIDVLPFRDLRENLIRIGHQIDEDDFLLDFFNNVICWGGVPGSKTGRPWDGRSWEASPFFLQKWAAVVGGQDGELTRQSLWWRSMRGEETDDV